VRLRDLYVGQLDHMQRNLKSLRKQFLLQWQHESRKKKTGKVWADQRPTGGFGIVIILIFESL